MGKRLIDADALYKKFLHLYGTDKKATGANAYDLCAMLTEDAPTVDAVEVVRCKDCKHRGNSAVCPMTFSVGDDWWDKEDYTTDDGFCNKGEPKEKEKENGEN